MDKIELLRSLRPKNIITQNESVDILTVKKEEITYKSQLVDSIIFEGVDKTKKQNNEIQASSEVEILRNDKVKPENIIEEKESLFIPPKQKEPLNKAIVDHIIIEANNHPENNVQNTEKFELLKAARKKPENKIELKDSIYLSPEELNLNKQNLDCIRIEGIKPENKIQIIDKFNFLESPNEESSLPRAENIIEELQSLFIPQKEKSPLKNQIIDNILIEGNPRPENQIQVVIDKIDILKSPKPENIIESKEPLFIKSKEKDPLKSSLCNSLIIEGKEREENVFQKMDDIEVEADFLPEIQENVMEENQNLFIPPKEKLFNNQKTDNILIEGINRPDNEIQIVDKVEILKSKISKPEYIIELNDNLLIKSSDKKPLEYQNLDNLFIDAKERENNEIKNVDKIKILGNAKEKNVDNIMEENCQFIILPKKKQPLQYQLIDVMLIAGNENEDNAIQNTDKIEVVDEPTKPIQENKIVENINLFFYPKKKDSLKKQLIDSILVEAEKKESNTVPKFSKLDLLEKPKVEKFIEQKYNLIIPPEEKPLQYQLVDSLNIPPNLPLIQKFDGDKIIIKKPETFNLLSNIKEKKRLSEPLSINKFNVCIEGIKNQEEAIAEPDIKLRTKFSPKKDNIIQKMEPITILPKKDKKEPEQFNKINIISNEKEEPIKLQKSINEIQSCNQLEIFPSNIEKNILQKIERKEKEETKEILNEKNKDEIAKESEENILPSKKYLLIEDKMDDLILESLVKPKNEIENRDRFLILSRKKEEKKAEQVLKPENKIEQIKTLNIPKTAKEPNKIINLDQFNIISKEKEKMKEIEQKPLIKENIDEIKLENKAKIKNINNYEIKHLDTILLPQKQESPYEIEGIDELPVEGEIRPENAIESTKRMKILKIEKPKNEIVNQEEEMTILSPHKKEENLKYNNEIEKALEISILTKEKPKNEIKSKEPLLKINNEELSIEGNKKVTLLAKKFNDENLIEDKPYYMNIEGIKNLQIAKPENEIDEREKILIPPKKKEPLLKINNGELCIKVDKALLRAKKIENLVENKENYIYFEGKKMSITSRIFENLQKNQNNLFILAGKKEAKGPLLVDKKDNLCFEGIEENVKPQIISHDNEISKGDKIFIPSKKKEPLLYQIDSKNINIDFIKPKKEKKSIRVVESILPFNILAQPKKRETKPELFMDQSPKEFTNIYIGRENSFSLKETGPKSQIISNIKDKNELTLITQNFEFEIERSKQIEEKNIDPEIIQELYLLRNKKKKLLEEIKPNSEKTFFIQGIQKPKFEEKIEKKGFLILPTFQSNGHFSIFGTQKKPYVIQNKGCFNIISCGNPSKKNNLIVQGSCFGLFGNQNEPSQVTQDIEKLYLLKLRNNWKENMSIQKFSFPIEVNNVKISWNDFIKQQRSVKFDINKEKKPLDLKIVNTSQISLFNQKGKDEEIIKDDYNYTSLEKEEKQRRTVKATISKVYREKEEDNDINDLDTFSSCVKHTGRKYDKIFKERKTTSARVESGIKHGSIVIKGDSEMKKKSINFKDKINKEESIMIKNESERKTGPVIFKNLKDQQINFGINTYKDIGKNRSVGLFKIKEKKTEYLRDYDNEPRYFN